MAHINICYDYSFNGTDIISIPNYLIPIIEVIAQEFLNWLPPDYLFNNDNGWVMLGSEKVVSKNTDGFINWINDLYCIDGEKEYIVNRETTINKKFLVIDF